ncbi:MAG: hypothetical protein ACI9PY_002288 [Ascidiaceihabitans sp.]|jgi:hypothetical protein
MIRRLLAVILLSFAAAPVAAKDIVLGQPIDCKLGQDCYIQQYVDHDPSNGAHDYRCQSLSYNKHKGTDFALRSTQQMARGVNVIAAASGTVRGVRDGVADRLYSDANAENVAGRECGNGVVINHGDGWETQYCHMKKGSIAVKKGQTVNAQTVLGQVGLSGRTQFPHVHLSVRKDGNVVDPFDPDGKISCGKPGTETLWKDALVYQPGAILHAGFHDGVPKFADVKSGRASMQSLPTNAPAIVVYGYAFGTRKGDEIQLVLSGPDGVMVDQKVKIEKQQAQMFRAAGKRLKSAAWPTGTYSGSAALLRNGRVISVEKTQIQIR